MTKMVVNPQTQTMRQLLANGLKYKTPPFQRNYAWEKGQWSELWEDILRLPQEESHYMGYLVLQSEDNQHFTIIDGQQRLATLNILILAAQWCLSDLVKRGIKAKKNKAHLDNVFRPLLRIYHPKSTEYHIKLTLNRADSDFFHRLADFDFPPSKSMQQKSARRMWDAFDFFKGKLEEYLNPMSGDKIVDFFDKHILNGLFFTSLQVQDDENAYVVFETLNARGVELSSADLVKNLLFSMVVGGYSVASDKFQQAQASWDGILTAVGSRDVTTFLRHYWNSREGSVDKTGLYKALRTKIKKEGKEFASQFLSDLRRNAEIYRLLLDPGVPDWDPKQRDLLRRLKLYGNATSRHYPLLLAAYRKWDRGNEFTRVLEYCAVLIFRGLVVGNLGADALGRACQAAALKIERGKARRARGVLPLLRDAYLDDKVFIAAFEFLELSENKRNLIRHILTVLENDIRGDSAVDENSGDMTIEHILPRSQTIGWDEFADGPYSRYVWRLGNLTLQKKSQNRDCGRKTYSKKQEIYRNSGYRITVECAESHNEWTPERLANRQEWMAKKAAEIWHIEF